MNNGILGNIGEEIKEILYEYIKIESYTYSEKERNVEKFFKDYFGSIEYFKKNQDHYGTYKIDGDVYDRSVCYAMVKGKGDDSVVFVHHYDIVEIEDFKLLKPYAFSPEKLYEELVKIEDTLPENAAQDLRSKKYIFGRGTADMKGGGSIQMSLLRRYSNMEDFNGNIIMIAVPDEENMSAGMRAAVKLLAELKRKYNLQYKMTINSEPHQRKHPNEGVFSEGSVGKAMPFVYARGYLSHIGKVFEGLNPLNIISSIITKTELNLDMAEIVGDESAPPPTWLYLRDSKTRYDVSMPLSAAGCFSVLTLDKSPLDLMVKVGEICREAFEQVVNSVNERYKRFSQMTDPVAKDVHWKSNVMEFSQLYDEAYSSRGEEFEQAYTKKKAALADSVSHGKMTIIESNFSLVEFIFDYIDGMEPRVVYGLVPPYYPNVSNRLLENMDESLRDISNQLNEFTQKEFKQVYTKENFYTGISDLSYCSIKNGKSVLNKLKSNMPLFGDFYNIPVEEIEEISMPCINIGPWGKDFHKLTERVLAEDLYDRTPRIINKAISIILNNPTIV